MTKLGTPEHIVDVYYRGRDDILHEIESDIIRNPIGFRRWAKDYKSLL